jgi:hypothetical protein
LQNPNIRSSAEHGFEDFAGGGAFGFGFPQARSSLAVGG